MHKHFIGILQNQGDNQKYYNVQFVCKLTDDKVTSVTKGDKERRIKRSIYILEKRNEDLKRELDDLLLTEGETNLEVISLRTKIRKNEFQINYLNNLLK